MSSKPVRKTDEIKTRGMYISADWGGPNQDFSGFIVATVDDKGVFHVLDSFRQPAKYFSVSAIKRFGRLFKRWATEAAKDGLKSNRRARTAAKPLKTKMEDF